MTFRASGIKRMKRSKESLDAALSDNAFEELKRVLEAGDNYVKWAVGATGNTIDIEVDEEATIYGSITSLIMADTGKAPCRFLGAGVFFHRRSYHGEWKPEFSVIRRRSYSREDLDRAEFLSIFPLKNVASLSSVRSDGIPVVKSEWPRDEMGFASNSRLGALFPSARLGTKQSLSSELKKLHLVGFEAYTAPFEGAKPGNTEPIDWISSSITLPRSILDVCDGFGNPYVEGKSKSCEFVAHTEPAELVYRGADLKNISFDIAKTTEIIGTFPEMATPYLVVSQRFRHSLEVLNENDVQYAPVGLV